MIKHFLVFEKQIASRNRDRISFLCLYFLLSDFSLTHSCHFRCFVLLQAILGDPVVRQVIQDLGTNDPVAQRSGQKAMQDPVMSAKIQKLIAAGVLRTG